MTLPPLDLFLLLGAVQGFIFATLLWTSRRGRRLSNRLLAALIGILALASLAVGNPSGNVWVRHAIDLLPFFMIMPLGPLIYFYVQSVLDPAFTVGKSERRHFWPILLDWGAPLMGWTFIVGALAGIVNPKDGPGWGYVMDEYNAYVDIPRWLSVTAYLIITRRWLRGQPGATSGAQGRWLRELMGVFTAFQGIWLLYMIPYIVPNLRGPVLDWLDWYPLYLPITVMIYWLGLRGYLQSRQYVVEPVARKSTEVPPEQAAPVIAALTKAMEHDRLFLDPELSLGNVAEHINVAPKTLSAVLNGPLQINFNGFVNRYRVEAVKQRLTDSGSEHLTLTGIAFECGFNSQATFQRTFRQLTGVSPSEYVAQQTKSALKSGFE